jgi:hypothetical protein
VSWITLFADRAKSAAAEERALDYRTSQVDPRVVASDWIVGVGCIWREVAPTFLAFVETLGL